MRISIEGSVNWNDLVIEGTRNLIYLGRPFESR